MQLNGQPVVYSVQAVQLLPGETLRIHSENDTRLAADSGHSTPAARGWRWRAPDKPGHYPLSIHSDAGVVTINALVLRPAEEIRDGRLKGYAIGKYPHRNGASTQPAGFIEIWPETENVQLSPHFRLGQFICKQSGGYPKYALVDRALVDKLEELLAQVNAAGHAAETLTVMSGFRTPHYNASLNNAQFSQHIYGRAADVYVDQAAPRARMDDLDADGASDIGDVHWLYHIAQGLESTGAVVAGGLGGYHANAHHGPFLHVDARGTAARWGALPARIEVSDLR